MFWMFEYFWMFVWDVHFFFFILFIYCLFWLLKCVNWYFFECFWLFLSVCLFWCYNEWNWIRICILEEFFDYLWLVCDNFYECNYLYSFVWQWWNIFSGFWQFLAIFGNFWQLPIFSCVFCFFVFLMLKCLKNVLKWSFSVFDW